MKKLAGIMCTLAVVMLVGCCCCTPPTPPCNYKGEAVAGHG